MTVIVTPWSSRLVEVTTRPSFMRRVVYGETVEERFAVTDSAGRWFWDGGGQVPWAVAQEIRRTLRKPTAPFKRAQR